MNQKLTDICKECNGEKCAHCDEGSEQFDFEVPFGFLLHRTALRVKNQASLFHKYIAENLIENGQRLVAPDHHPPKMSSEHIAAYYKKNDRRVPPKNLRNI